MAPSHRAQPVDALAHADVWLVTRSHDAPQAWTAAQGALSEHRAHPLPGDVPDQLREYLTSVGQQRVRVEVTWGLFRLGHLLPNGARPAGVIVDGHYCGSDWLAHLDPPGDVLAELLEAARASTGAALREVVTDTVELNGDPLVVTVPTRDDADTLPGYLARVAQVQVARP